DVDQHGRRDDAAPDIDHEIGAAADEAAVGVLGKCLDDVVQRARAHQGELRHRVHQSPRPGGPPLPARRRLPCDAHKRTVWTGSTLKRTPRASAMALVSAGRNAASDPSPASFAPNGPCGSLLSTMPTSIGGESWMVGTR